MYSFPRISGEPNFIGYNAFYFLPTSAISSMEEAINAVIDVTGITYAGSPDWFLGYSISDKLTFKDEPARNEAGIYYPVSLQGTAPVDKPEYLALFQDMVHEEFIVVLQDNNKRRKILGTKQKGLRFLYKTENVGYTFEFKGDYDSPPPFLSGVISVNGSSVGSVLTPAGTYIRAARWLFGAGAPGTGVGNQWDAYVDTFTTNVYSKETGVWVFKMQLVDQELQEVSYIYSSLSITGNL